MSQAFIKESEEMSLQEVSPSITALNIYLTCENNGIRVYEKHQVMDSENERQVHAMSNGLSYSKNEDGKWYVI